MHDKRPRFHVVLDLNDGDVIALGDKELIEPKLNTGRNLTAVEATEPGELPPEKQILDLGILVVVAVVELPHALGQQQRAEQRKPVAGERFVNIIATDFVK